MCGKRCEGSQVAPLARGTRTIRMCSFDARSGGATWPPSCQDVFRSGEGKSREWSGMIFCARVTRGRRRIGRGAAGPFFMLAEAPR
jgi:hypothetical protein